MRTPFFFLLLYNVSFAFSQGNNQLAVTWLNPNPIKFHNGIVTTNQEFVKLEFIIKTAYDENEVRNHLKIWINGVDLKQGEKTLGVTEIRKKESDCLVSQEVQLVPDKNIIQIELGIPGKPRQISEKLPIIWLSEEKPKLYLLSVGVSSNLSYTKKDAESIYNLLAGQYESLFQTVRGELLVCPENTTKAKIATTIEKIKYQGLRQNDVLILFFSGHGMNSLNDADDFYLETSDAQGSVSSYSLISYQNDIIRHLKDLDCKRIILIDACQSGAASRAGQKTSNVDFSRIQRIISQTPPSIVTLTSSSGNESSWEDKEWEHGAFTKALLDGLRKNADENNDGIVWLKEIAHYVIKKVPQLTAGKAMPQHPQLIYPISNDFPLFNYSRPNKEYKPRVIDCPVNAVSNKQSALSIIAISDAYTADWDLTEKVKEKIAFLAPQSSIGKFADDSGVKSGVINGLKGGNARLAEKLPKDLGARLFIVSRKTTFNKKPIVGQVIWEARTYLHFTEIDTRTGKIVNSFESDDTPTVKSDPVKQKAEQMSIKLTLDQLPARYFN